jgi:hypothetical protein
MKRQDRCAFSVVAVFFCTVFGFNLLAADLPNGIMGNASSDLVIGSPGYPNKAGDSAAGGFGGLYSSPPFALFPLSYRFIHPGLDGILDSHSANDEFGSSLALGDFNNDGFADVAIGVPGKTISGVSRAGLVHIMQGSSNGVSTLLEQLFYQGYSGLPGSLEENDKFGSVVVSGDFNGDGYDDLVIGIPKEDIGTTVDAGAIQVLYGSANKLTVSNQLWYQSNIFSGAPASEEYDYFGAALSTGDYNGDGYDDLAVGAYGEDYNSLDVNATGMVTVIYGSREGLNKDVLQTFMQNVTVNIHDQFPNLPEVVIGKYDWFGKALSSGDYNCDGYVDLAIGIPGDTLDNANHEGSVVVVYGSKEKLNRNSAQLWYANGKHKGAAYDHFGAALASGDFNGNGCDDLAVGIPLRNYGESSNVGAVRIIYSDKSGLSETDGKFYLQSSFDGAVEANDEFGSVMSVGDFDNDGYMDLVVGVPNDTVIGQVYAGVINYMFGSATGLNPDRGFILSRATPDVDGDPLVGEKFGAALASMPPRKYRKKGIIVPFIMYLLH